MEIILNAKTRLNSHGYSASFSCLRFFLHLLVKIEILFYACVEEGCSASLTIARGKQHEIHSIYGGLKLKTVLIVTYLPERSIDMPLSVLLWSVVHKLDVVDNKTQRRF